MKKFKIVFQSPRLEKKVVSDKKKKKEVVPPSKPQGRQDQGYRFS